MKDEIYPEYAYLKENAEMVLSAVEAAREASRYHQNVTVLAATKYATAEEINALVHTGAVHDIGENRVQQLLEKYDKLDRDAMNIHFIGSLQKNKVKYIIDKVCLIHSVDSLGLAQEIDRCAALHGKTMDILMEINIGREESKGGILPEEASDFAEKLMQLPHVRLRGIMTMAPKTEELIEYNKYFEETYHIFIDIFSNKLHNIYEPILSMGMSDSFPRAIHEGATLIRVGSAFFRHS